jgi:hypothetical protein
MRLQSLSAKVIKLDVYSVGTRDLYQLNALNTVQKHTVSKQNWVQPTGVTRTQYTKSRLCSAFRGWASNGRNM